MRFNDFLRILILLFIIIKILSYRITIKRVGRCPNFWGQLLDKVYDIL